MCGNGIVIILLLFTIAFRVCVPHRRAYACAMHWPDLPCVEVTASIRMPSSDTFHLICWERVSCESGACRFSWTDWPGSLQDLPVYLCSYQLQAHGAPPSAFYNGSGNINSGSRALGMSTLPTEPPPQPLCTTKASPLPFYSTNTCEHIQETSSHRWWAKINLSLIWIQYESTLFWAWHSSANLHLGDCGGKTAVDLGLFWTVRLYLKRPKTNKTNKTKCSSLIFLALDAAQPNIPVFTCLNNIFSCFLWNR